MIDTDATIDAIVGAARLPLSIVIVGVQNEVFTYVEIDACMCVCIDVWMDGWMDG